MMHIGETLKNAREAKSLTLDDIQEVTKIQKRYLVAIEQNDFHVLPGRFYARAFIKEYAQAVDLDATELLAEFDEDDIETEESTEQDVQYSRLERTKTPQTVKSTSVFSWIPTVIVVILIIGIVFVAWTFLKQSSSESEQNQAVQNDNEIIRDAEIEQTNEENDNEEAEDEEEAEEKEDEEEKEEEKDEGTFSVLEEGTGASPLSTVEFSSDAEKLEVSFEVTEESYMELKGANENVLLSNTYNADSEMETFDVTDEERIYVNIGYAPGVIVKINDVPLEYPADKDEKVHQKIWVNFVKE
ncbi:MAG TPA: RodZ domain-containing protein [Pseudogracilibacillus sp.]|nr:RodZ domain-containing protein [Pseudogracilibacillus sp.]